MSAYRRLTFYLEELDPELAHELDEVRVHYVERTGRPGYHFGDGSERIFLDLGTAVERARALHEEGHRVSLFVRFARRETDE